MISYLQYHDLICLTDFLTSNSITIILIPEKILDSFHLMVGKISLHFIWTLSPLHVALNVGMALTLPTSRLPSGCGQRHQDCSSSFAPSPTLIRMSDASPRQKRNILRFYITIHNNIYLVSETRNFFFRL